MKTWVLTATLLLVSSMPIADSVISHSNTSCTVNANEKELLQPLNLAEISFFGVWKVDKVAGYGRVSVEDEIARQRLGEQVSFRPEVAVICNKQIKPVYYYKLRILKNDFFKYTWVNAEKLGIEGPEVEFIIISARNPLDKADWRYEYNFVVKNESSILINCENVWFELVRENP
jgi:hypothetical protein